MYRVLLYVGNYCVWNNCAVDLGQLQPPSISRDTFSFCIFSRMLTFKNVQYPLCICAELDRLCQKAAAFILQENEKLPRTDSHRVLLEYSCSHPLFSAENCEPLTWSSFVGIRVPPSLAWTVLLGFVHNTHGKTEIWYQTCHIPPHQDPFKLI